MGRGGGGGGGRKGRVRNKVAVSLCSNFFDFEKAISASSARKTRVMEVKTQETKITTIIYIYLEITALK